jgi:hypothetical protein
MEIKTKSKSGAGRPKIQLDERQIRELASIGCAMTEIAVVMDCHVDTLRDNYSKAIDEGRENGKVSLRRAQWKAAIGGNVQMLIWLGRFHLAQKEEMSFSSNEADVRKLLENWNVSATKKSTFDKARDEREGKVVAIG